MYKKVITIGALALAVLLPQVVHAAPGRPHTVATRHLDMIYVTMVKVQTEAQINDFVQPSDGNVFVTVWLRAVNRNDVQKGVSSQDFHLLPPSGEVVDPSYTTPDPALGGLFAPGGHMYGSVTFEAPKGTHKAILRWAPSPDYMDAHWPEMTWSLHF